MVEMLSLAVVILAALYFLSLALVALFRPELAKSFLLGFATTAFKHYLELALRLIVGASLIILAPKMSFSLVFTIAGWVLIGTTAVLILVPPSLHRRFAEKSVPEALKYLPLIAIASAAIGVFILFSLIQGAK